MQLTWVSRWRRGSRCVHGQVVVGAQWQATRPRHHPRDWPRAVRAAHVVAAFVPSGSPSSAARPPSPLTGHPPRPCACWAAPASSRALWSGAGGNHITINGWRAYLLLVDGHRPRRWSRWATLSRPLTRRPAASGAACQRGSCRRSSGTFQWGRWPLGDMGKGRSALPSIHEKHDGDHGSFH